MDEFNELVESYIEDEGLDETYAEAIREFADFLKEEMFQ